MEMLNIFGIFHNIAIFQDINNTRRDYVRSKLKEIAVPCITMVRTFPRFYLVPITGELSYSIMYLLPSSRTLTYTSPKYTSLMVFLDPESFISGSSNTMRLVRFRFRFRKPVPQK